MSLSASRLNVYRQPGFMPFVIARLLAVFAMQIQAIVVAWQIYEITGDPLSLAWVGLAQFLPMLFLLMPAGDLIDRYSRKLILSLSWLGAALCSGILLWLSTLDEPNLVWFYGALVLYGCSRAFIGPALQSLLPQIVPRDQLAQAIAANSTIMRTATILGPVLGGVLYAIGGGELTYAICLVCFAGGLLLLSRVPVLYAETMQITETSGWKRFTAGLHFIRTRPIILGTISLDLFAVLLGGVVALLPIYASDVLHVGPEGLGILRSAMAVGEICVGLYLSAKPFNRNVGSTMFIAVAIFGVANVVFALSTLFWLSFAALLVAGAADMVSVYIRSALIQFSTPDAMRGRVNAVNMLFIGSSNELGNFRAGTSAAWFGAVPAALIGALCTLGVVAGWAAAFRPLRQVDRFEDASPERQSDTR
ncbi:Predicted arabinose efflux permease, MFS family [Halopseudomonas litoralis]|uniref:Predicted arabinose efflux permease, MFS family n=1 Tax=Halopseudomonas litoralis TaxID=797277 RepID=A0A1H1WK47_9GAMM|nr:MFS transporter [Halopseudomonas litoralis]SDS97362.1 Predicted arabinose efflux permease, MFS family [Halopseudomonas litoralis]